MGMRVVRLMLAVTVLVAMWGLSVLRTPNSKPWVRSTSVRPGPVHILRFYASVGMLLPGQHAQLCYSVENAKSITISPAIARAYPSAGRCVEIGPEHTTHYTLQAEGFDGTTDIRSFTLSVQDEPGLPSAPRQYALLLTGAATRRAPVYR